MYAWSTLIYVISYFLGVCPFSWKYIYIYIYGHVYLVCLSNSVCGTTTGTFSWHQPYIDYILTKYDQILSKYDQISTKHHQNNQIHVDFFQERHFLEIKKSNVKNQPGFCFFVGGALGYRGAGE